MRFRFWKKTVSEILNEQKIELTTGLVGLQKQLISSQSTVIINQDIQIRNLMKYSKQLQEIIDVQKEMLQML